MNNDREAFLQRVRRAVAEGNRAGQAPPHPARGSVGYQGAGPDAVARFCAEWTAAGGQAHVVADAEAAAARVAQLTREKAARRVLLSGGPVVDRLGLPQRLRDLGIEVTTPDALTPEGWREPAFAADLGVSGVAHLIAETGSVVLAAGPGWPRSVSLLPPVHIAVADRSQILPDLFDLFDPHHAGDPPRPPSALTLVTGPSKTGDIELRLVTGVHGPGEVHVILLA
jgi:L-lactate utilization protein LutC